MSFKRVLLIVLAGALAISLTACGGDKQVKELALGTVRGNVYTNDFFDLKVMSLFIVLLFFLGNFPLKEYNNK